MTHYDQKYFDWQSEIGIVGGILNKFKFEKHVNESDVLMDFGCGGGYLLSNFANKQKIGFEINKSAWNECKKNNVDVVDNFDAITNESIDTIISNHALEHVPLPLETLKNLYAKLKPNGKLIVVVPYEQPHESGFEYKPNNVNQHLHTWCPMTLGNLATLAGFNVVECKTFQHKWTPSYKNEYKNTNYHKKCIDYAIKERNFQIKLIATKNKIT